MCMFVESGGQTNQNFIMNLSSPYVFYSIKHKVVFKQSGFFGAESRSEFQVLTVLLQVLFSVLYCVSHVAVEQSNNSCILIFLFFSITLRDTLFQTSGALCKLQEK